MNREYYILWYRLDNQYAYLIWFSTEKDDGVFTNESGQVPSFDNVKDLRNYAKLNKIKLKPEEPLLLDLDKIKNWLKEINNKIEDYNPFLDAWNLFEDVSNSTSKDFDKYKNYNIYEKIFWGSNITVITPEGESFTPSWTKKESKIIRETLNFGLLMFREKVTNH